MENQSLEVCRKSPVRPRKRDTLLGLLKTAQRLSAPLAARSGNSRFLGLDNLPEPLAAPAAGNADLEFHLFAADGAPLTRCLFADPNCPAGSAVRAGAAR